jgi:hypothetical protein
MTDEKAAIEDPLPLGELKIDFSFGPGWAKAPPPAHAFEHADGFDEGDRRRGRFNRDAGGGDRDRRGGRDASRRRPGSRDRGESESMPGSPRMASASVREEPLPALDLEIEFFPERRGLAPLAHRLARSGRAFSLFEVSSLFLSKPEFYAVRIAIPEGAAGGTIPMLFQCQDCKMVFADRMTAETHAFERHYEKFYRKEEIEAESPKGQFVCVARCTLSGEILGPPNYHGYQERLLALHKARFGHLTLDDYRKKIETLHDPAMVEQWKDQMKVQTVYHRLDAPEGTPALARWSDLERDFRERQAAVMIQDGRNFVIPGVVATVMEDGRIRSIARLAWNHEARFPLKLSIVLRLAFRRLGLHLFKTAEGATYVTSICPAALDAAKAVPVVREILDYLAAHPRVKINEIAPALRPGVIETDPTVLELTRALRWLVDRGHVIEFNDGRVMAPDQSVLRVQHARRKQRGKGDELAGGRPAGGRGDGRSA